MEIGDEVGTAFSLHGKLAVVTGAGSGLGQEAARIFAAAGAQVLASDIDEPGLALNRRSNCKSTAPGNRAVSYRFGST
jgi:NAD(P)-dependent dehydrogenase (short-subunit alcohol dehydrogenase family)